MPNALTRHIDNVIAVGTGALAVRAAGPESLFHKSWARCMSQHGLDPTRPTPARETPRRLDVSPSGRGGAGWR